MNFVYSMLCIYGFSRNYSMQHKYKYISCFVLLFPIWSIWLIICGGQYNVGTDYFTYIDVFKNVDIDLFVNKGEYLFSLIIIIANQLYIPEQGIFYIFYFIGFVFLILIMLELDIKTCFIYILLYFTISNLFHNQLNELRQAIAIYICTYAVLLLNKDRGILKFLLLVYCASLFHSSALFMLILLPFKKYQSISALQCYILLSFCSLFSVFGSFSWVLSIFDFAIPSYYKIYLGSAFDMSNSLMRVLPKLIWIPFYLFSISILNNNWLSKSDIYLYMVGFVSYALRLFFLQNIIFTRVGNLFVLLSVFPLYFYLKYLYESNQKGKFALISCTFVLFYMLKILLFPIDEYAYQSVYANCEVIPILQYDILG